MAREKDDFLSQKAARAGDVQAVGMLAPSREYFASVPEITVGEIHELSHSSSCPKSPDTPLLEGSEWDGRSALAEAALDGIGGAAGEVDRSRPSVPGRTGRVFSRFALFFYLQDLYRDIRVEENK